MGAWSTRIMDDDGARDIIDEYKILMGYGVEEQKAYEVIYDNFYKDYEGQDDEDVFWLAIALYQWKNGILREDVKEKAIASIDNQEYLERWKESGEKVYQKRKETLEEFRNNLLYEVNEPPRKFSKCPKYLREKTCWEVGDLLVYQMLGEPRTWSGSTNRDVFLATEKKLLENMVLLRVVDVIKRPVTHLMPELDYASVAHVMVYDWMGKEIPNEKIISRLEFRPVTAAITRGTHRMVCGIGLEWSNTKREREKNRIECIASDDSFVKNKPPMYVEHQGCPLQMATRFNVSLVQTFSMNGMEGTKWMYD